MGLLLLCALIPQAL